MSFLKKLFGSPRHAPRREETPSPKRVKSLGLPLRRTESNSSDQSRGSPTISIAVRTPPSRHVAKVLPGMLLGGIEVANDLHALHRYKVTHILNVTTEVANYFPHSFHYVRIDIPDLPSVNIIKHFDQAFGFIDEARKAGAVLVHCYYGNSRSASIVLAYLMKTEHMRFKEALEYLHILRPGVSPNDGFYKQLKEYELKIRR